MHYGVFKALLKVPKKIPCPSLLFLTTHKDMEFFSELFLSVTWEQDEHICQKKITSKNV